MALKEVTKDILWVGAIDWDRMLFDELIPLPDGTSYNAYLIREKDEGLLIDTVDPTMQQVLSDNIEKSKIKNIKYIIANHAEQDHSGCIADILQKYPECKVITNQKCKKLLMDELLIPDSKFIVIKDGESFFFGQKEFQFIFAPWVHWPETMLTFMPKENILFTCDLFGSHLASSEIWAVSDQHLYSAAKRYYAEIMMPFRKNIQKHLKKIENLHIKIIAPSHGPIYKQPDYILKAYQEWTSDKVKNEVIIPYVSMHGSTKEMVSLLIENLMSKDIKVIPFNLTRADIGELAVSMVDAATLIIASPAVLSGPHPQIVYAAYLANILRPKTKYAGIIGSFGWGSRLEEIISEMLSNLKVELLPSVITKGFPEREDKIKIDQLANKIAEKHSGMNKNC